MSVDLKKLAKGKPCQIRIYGCCNRDDSTTVLAHIRMMGITGTGQKAHDFLGAWACSSCHDLVDGRVKSDFDREYIRSCFYEGVLRTQALILRERELVAA
jgi:hypothetical protein